MKMSLCTFRDRLISLACLLLAGCAAAPPPPPKAPLPPLHSSVTGAMIPALTGFAATTRMCREIFNRQVQEDVADFFRRNPEASIYPTGHGEFVALRGMREAQDRLAMRRDGQ
jgi:hypothetical protein